MTDAERRWLREHRPSQAAHWNMLSTMNAGELANAYDSLREPWRSSLQELDDQLSAGTTRRRQCLAHSAARRNALSWTCASKGQSEGSPLLPLPAKRSKFTLTNRGIHEKTGIVRLDYDALTL